MLFRSAGTCASPGFPAAVGNGGDKSKGLARLPGPTSPRRDARHSAERKPAKKPCHQNVERGRWGRVFRRKANRHPTGWCRILACFLALSRPGRRSCILKWERRPEPCPQGRNGGRILFVKCLPALGGSCSWPLCSFCLFGRVEESPDIMASESL